MAVKATVLVLMVTLVVAASAGLLGEQMDHSVARKTVESADVKIRARDGDFNARPETSMRGRLVHVFRCAR